MTEKVNKFINVYDDNVEHADEKCNNIKRDWNKNCSKKIYNDINSDNDYDYDIRVIHCRNVFNAYLSCHLKYIKKHE